MEIESMRSESSGARVSAKLSSQRRERPVSVSFSIEEHESGPASERQHSMLSSSSLGEKKKMRPKSSLLVRRATASMSAGITQAALLRSAGLEEDGSVDSHSRTGDLNLNVFKNLKNEPGLTGEDRMRADISQECITGSLKSAVASQKVNTGMRVTRRDLIRAVANDEKMFRTCLKLPVVVVYFSVFILFFQAHYNTSAMFVQETAVRSELGDGTASAATPEEVFGWMADTLFPFLWSCPNVAGAADASGPNLLIGGAQLRTARTAVSQPCEDALPGDPKACVRTSSRVRSDAPALADWSFGPSSASGGVGRRLQEETLAARRAAVATRRQLAASSRASAPSQRRDPAVGQRRRLDSARSGFAPPARRLQRQASSGSRRLREFSYAWLDAPIDVWSTESVYSKNVPMSSGLAEVQSMIRGFQNATAPLVEPSTLFVSVEFMFLNEEISQGVLTNVVVSFLFSRGGGIYSQTSMQSFPTGLKANAMGFLGLTIICLMYLSIMLIASIWIAARKRALKATFRGRAMELLTDLAVVCIGWVIIFFVALEVVGVSTIMGLWEDYSAARSSAAGGDAGAAGGAAGLAALDGEWLEKIFERTAGERSVAGMTLFLVAMYTLILIFRFLMSTMGHPRLAMIIRTLSNSMSDLVHLLLITTIIFLSFVFSGHILFGRRMEEFSTIKGSVGYCMQIMFQRQFDIATITAENGIVGSLWTVTFVIATVLVMLNLVLAMLFGSYGEVRESTDTSHTVLSFFRRLFRQLRFSSSWLSNTELLALLVTLPSGESLTMAQVQRSAPDMCSLQLKLLMHDAAAGGMLHQASNRKHIVTFVANVLLSISEVRRGVQALSVGSAVRAVDRASIISDLAKDPADAAPAAPTAKLAGGTDFDKAMAAEAPAPALAPEEQPKWVSRGLVPHLQKQKKVLEDAKRRVELMKGYATTKRGVPMDTTPPGPGCAARDAWPGRGGEGAGFVNPQTLWGLAFGDGPERERSPSPERPVAAQCEFQRHRV